MTKKLFYFFIFTFIINEFLISYLLRPYPGSQQLNLIQLSYFLWQIKPYFESVIVLCIGYTGFILFRHKYRLPTIVFSTIAFLCYLLFSLKLSANHKYIPSKEHVFMPASKNKVETNLVAIELTVNNTAKAYPIPFLEVYHLMNDSIDDKAILVTFCTQCRTARIYKPYVNGVFSTFLLVGLFHNNAIIEDMSTKSWWSQSSGECIAGSLKGKTLEIIQSKQMTIKFWLSLHPKTLILQADPLYEGKYTFNNYFLGTQANPVTMNQNNQWHPNTFIVGIVKGNEAIAIEWQNLNKKQLIIDSIGKSSFFVVLAADHKSFVAFENNQKCTVSLHNDTIFLDQEPYNLAGNHLRQPTNTLLPINASRQLWFGWKHDHPLTKQHYSSYINN
jgi:Protein of unknown function (DUF3179)